MALPATVTELKAPAFAELYAAHAARIARYLHRRLGPDAVEDATAEVFLRALRGYGSYEPRHETPLPWLYGIAAHVVADDRRRERRRLDLLERLARLPAPDCEQIAPAAGDARVVAAVRGLFQTLAELRRYRNAFLLLLAFLAIALAVPVGTVKSRLFRATQAMRSALGAEASSSRLIEGRIR